MFGLTNTRPSSSNPNAPPGTASRSAAAARTRSNPQLHQQTAAARTASPGPSQSVFGRGGSGTSRHQQQQDGQTGARRPAGGSGLREEESADGMGMGMDEAPEILSDQQLAEIQEAFRLFDLNRDERIDYHELKVACKALGFDLSKPELLSLLRSHGILANNAQPAPTTPASQIFITRDAFTDIMTQKMMERDPDEEIARAFELFAGVAGEGQVGQRGGRSGDVKIGIEDLRRVATELGETLDEQELRAMIEEFDVDNDGLISREEFMAICKGE